MERKLSCGQRAALDTAIAALIQQHGRAEVGKALRRHKNRKALGRPQTLNEARDLWSWAQVEAVRSQQKVATGRPCSVMAACAKLAGAGGLQVPRELSPGGIGDIAVRRGANAKRVAGVWPISNAETMRKCHQRGQKLIDQFPATIAQHWGAVAGLIASQLGNN